MLDAEEYKDLMAGSRARAMIEFGNLPDDYLPKATDFVRIGDLVMLRLLLVSTQ